MRKPTIAFALIAIMALCLRARADWHWDPVGAGTDGWVRTLSVHDDGSGQALYAGGVFEAAGGQSTGPAARWNGRSWSSVSGGMGPINEVESLCSYAGQLYCAEYGGSVSRWDGAEWSFFTYAAGELPGTVLTLAAGPALYAGGHFTEMIPFDVGYGVAMWNGYGWSGMAGGVSPDGCPVTALVWFNGSLYAGGNFTQAGGVAVNRIARWDGGNWHPLGDGIGAAVESLTIFDDGSGAAVYAGAANGEVRKWDGTTWSLLGSQLGGTVWDMTVFDDGSGQALYAAAGPNVLRWDGSGWCTLAGGMDGDVLTVAGFRDPGGPALYAGGYFSSAGGAEASNIAVWHVPEPASLAMLIAGAFLTAAHRKRNRPAAARHF